MCSKQISQYLIRQYCFMGNPFGSKHWQESDNKFDFFIPLGCDILFIKISLNFSSKV